MSEEWYWVRNHKDEDWTPAKRNARAAGGWTNDDTWEDFEERIDQFVLIPTPRECKKINLEKKFRNGLDNL